MRLSLQIILLTILLLIIEASGIFYLNILSARDYVNQQLRANTQNTADSLGLSLSEYLRNNNKPAMTTVANAIFDNGNYLHLKVETINKEVIVNRQLPKVDVDAVPSWFIHFIALKPPIVSANIMQGWHKYGKVYLQNSPNYVYLRLWTSTTKLFTLLSIATLIFILFSILIVHFVLRSLNGVTKQANAIMRREFPVNEHLPWTSDLKLVVTAMNKLSLQLKALFLRHENIITSLLTKHYQDELTMLANERSFNMRIDYLLSLKTVAINGSMFIFNLHNLEHIIVYDHTGFVNAMSKFAALINKQLDIRFGGFAAHLSDNNFVVILPFINPQEAKTFAQSIMNEWKGYKVDGDEIELNIGVLMFPSAKWGKQMTRKKLMDELYDVLKDSLAQGKMKISLRNHDNVKQIPDLHEVIRTNISNKTLNVDFIPVKALTKNQNILYYSLLANIKQADGSKLYLTSLESMCDKLGHSYELTQMLLDAIHDNKTIDKSKIYFIKLTDFAMLSEGFMPFLDDLLRKHANDVRNIGFDIPEVTVLQHFDKAKQFATILAKYDIPLGLSYVGRSLSNFTHFRKLPLYHIVINATFTRNIHENAINQEFIKEIVHIAHALKTKVIAEQIISSNEVEKLAELGLDGFIPVGY